MFRTDFFGDQSATLVAASIIASASLGYFALKSKNPLNSIPGERGLPFIGIVDVEKLMKQEYAIEAQKKYGDVFVLRVLGTESVNVCDPAIASNVLRDMETFGDRPSDGFFYFLPKGLLGLEYGDEWKRHRKSISPLFAEKFLKEYSSDIISTTNMMLRNWEEKIQTDPIIDVSKQLIEVTLDIIGLAGFGTNFNAINGEGTEFEKAGKDLLKGILVKSSTTNFIWKSFFGSLEKETFSAVKTFEKACNMIKERSSKMEETSMISTILNDQSLGEREVFNEMITLLLAGHETTGNTVTFVCYHLARYPEVQKKVQEEIDSIYSMDSFNEENLYEHVHKHHFPYIKAVIYETLRMIPTVPFLTRQTTKEVVLNGYSLPKDTTVEILQVAVNYREHWGDPFVFRPERFLNLENEAQFFKEMGFSPFGAGPRVCIGQRFAQLEAVLLVVLIFRKFSVEFKSQSQINLETTANITQSPKNGLPLKVSLRS